MCLLSEWSAELDSFAPQNPINRSIGQLLPDSGALSGGTLITPQNHVSCEKRHQHVSPSSSGGYFWSRATGLQGPKARVASGLTPHFPLRKQTNECIVHQMT